MPSGTYERTPEIRAKISRALTGRRLSARHRAKIAAGGRGRRPSAETRAKLSAARSVPLASTHPLTNGYIEIRTSSGWEYEHRVVMGLGPDDPRIVHHIDGDKSNNDRSNLQVFDSQATHARHHAKERTV